jgi:hypothetical protein
MADQSDQIAILIGSAMDREKKMIAIPLDQSRFSRYLYAS